MPLPLSPKIGFGMKVAVLPAAQAVFLTMYLYFIRLSAVVSSVSKRKLISAWPAVPTSWWPRSTSRPLASRFLMMSDRRSAKWSVGETGKYPPL